MNMLVMANDTPSIPLDRLSGSKTLYMTDLSKLVANKGSAPLMVINTPGVQKWYNVPYSPWKTFRQGS